MKKYTSIPGARLTVAIFAITTLSCLIVPFFFLDQPGSWVLFLWVAVGIDVGVSAYRLRALDRIEISPAGVRRRDRVYSWETLCVTVVRQTAVPFIGRPQLFAFFSDHYLTEEELKDRKSTMVMCLGTARWKHITRYYQKPVHWLPCVPASAVGVERSVLAHNQQYGQ